MAIGTNVLSSMQGSLTDTINGILPYVIPIFVLITGIGFLPRLVKKFSR